MYKTSWSNGRLKNRKLEWALTRKHPGSVSCTFLSHAPTTLSHQIPLPLPLHSSYLLPPFSSTFPFSVSFPCVPINPFPVHSSTQGLSVPITAGPSSPLLTHRPLSLSLYQLGINILKQRASWRAAHHRPCEILPLLHSTLLPIHQNDTFIQPFSHCVDHKTNLGLKQHKQSSRESEFTCSIMLRPHKLDDSCSVVLD